LIIRFAGVLWLDPILSILICLVILIWAYDLVRHSLSILIESTPRGISLSEVEQALRNLRGVHEVHDLHIWSITSGMNALTAHIGVDDQSLSALQSVRHDLEAILRDKFCISHTNLQFEISSNGKRPHGEN
jgi:cobalt-zinc-cadmium efflux system protein